MIPRGFISRALTGIVKYITNYSLQDVSQNYAIDMRGLRLSTGGYIMQRDFGCQQIYAGQTPPLPNGIVSQVIYDGWTIFDPYTLRDYDLVACICTRTDGFGGTRLKFFINDNGTWIELTRVLNAKVNGAPGNANYSTNINTITENGAVVVPGVNELQDFVVINTSTNSLKRTGVVISSNTGTAITNLQNYVGTGGSGGLNWQSGDNLVIYQSAALSDVAFDDTIGNNGAPQLRIMQQQDQRKFTIAMGNTGTTPVTRYLPIKFMRRPDQRKYFWTGVATNIVNLNVGGVKNWASEMGGGLTTLAATIGSAHVVIQAADGQQSTVGQYPQDSWLQIEFNVQNGAANLGYNAYCFFLVTVVYDDYQESDPVLVAYTGAANIAAVGINLQFNINFAKMPKNVTGFNVYDFRTSLVNAVTQTLYDRLDAVAQTDFILVTGTPIGTVLTSGLPTQAFLSAIAWTNFAPGNTSGYTIHGNMSWATDVARGGAISIANVLNHVYSMSRSLQKPRFMTRGGRDQGSIIAADVDDRTLVLTSYDGYVVHEDDNYVSTTPDNQGFRTRVQLNGQGELLGLDAHEDQLAAFKWSELELIDMIQGAQTVIPIDFVAQRSILKTDFGTFWAGNRGIYLLKIGGGNQVSMVIDDWQNLYDGTLQNSANTGSIVTATARKNVISGWDPTYEEACFQVQISLNGSTQEYLVFRYSPSRKVTSVRKFQIQAGGASQVAITHFTKHSDGVFIIGAPNNLLKYPVRGTYLDELTSAGSGGNGFDTWVTINVGEIYDLFKSNILYSFLLDFLGKTISGTGILQVDFYANNETTPYHTQTFLTDQIPTMRVVSPRGQFDSLRIKISVPSNQVADTKNLDISTFSFTFTQPTRIGNR